MAVHTFMTDPFLDGSCKQLLKLENNILDSCGNYDGSGTISYTSTGQKYGSYALTFTSANTTLQYFLQNDTGGYGRPEFDNWSVSFFLNMETAPTSGDATYQIVTGSSTQYDYLSLTLVLDDTGFDVYVHGGWTYNVFTPTVGQQHHIVITSGPSGFRIIVDGSVVFSTSAMTQLIYTRMGLYNAGYNGVFNVDHHRIFDKEISSAEIALLSAEVDTDLIGAVEVFDTSTTIGYLLIELVSNVLNIGSIPTLRKAITQVINSVINTAESIIKYLSIDWSLPELNLTEIYDITLSNGTVARFTPHDKEVTYNGNTYQPIPIMRSEVAYHSDLQVDRVTVTAGLIGLVIGAYNYTIPEVIEKELFRNAEITVRVIDYTYSDTGSKIIFDGNVSGNITYNEGFFILECGSILDRLNDKFPKLIYSEFCPHSLFDSYCGLDKLTYQESGTNTAASSTIITSSVFALTNQPQDYWLKGVVTITSGENSDVSRSIIEHGDGWVRTLLPFYADVEISATFDVVPGCDKSGETCDTKFSNYDNFLGFEYIPNPQELYNV